jgi:hypothetical protein
VKICEDKGADGAFAEQPRDNPRSTSTSSDPDGAVGAEIEPANLIYALDILKRSDVVVAGRWDVRVSIVDMRNPAPEK